MTRLLSVSTLWKSIIIFILIVQCGFVIRLYKWHTYNREPTPTKFVGFHLNWGRLGNQMFHLITGYGIARTLNRVHYLPFQEGVIDHVRTYLLYLKRIFPRLEQTYVLAQNGTSQITVPFAGSCCAYDDPSRLSGNSNEYLLLNFAFGQNPRYFEDYLPEIRNILQFSKEMHLNGSKLVDDLKITHSDLLCIHIRRTDFIEINVATDKTATVEAANDIARKKGISQFMIFGDDKKFMRDIGMEIVREGQWKEDAVLISDLEESMDLYIASRMCKSFLITAVTSSFGWWLAFFIPDQDAVYYLSDKRPHADKVNKEHEQMLGSYSSLSSPMVNALTLLVYSLSLSRERRSWQEYSGGVHG